MTGERCPLCSGERPVPFLQRRQVPVHQNLVVADQPGARSVARAELDLVVCGDCGFVFNRAFDPARLAYGGDYDNTQSCSPFFDRYLDGLVAEMVERQGVRDCTVVEVGCGKGGFLRKLVDYPGAGIRGVGFDPSYVGPPSEADGRLNFRTCYYDDSCTDVAADVVVCRHVIEHVPDPMALLHSVRRALGGGSQARVFFETPCVKWILDNRVVWDFFYEHCSLFSAASLGQAFARAGFAVERVDHIFGGQYLWLEARVGPIAPVAADAAAAAGLVASARAYGEGEAAMRKRWSDLVERFAGEGRTALWGAGAKGATFANLVDPDCRLIDCVIDLNPNKQGRYIPGSGHPIVAPGELPKRGVVNALLMNPNYRAENLQLLAAAGIPLNLIDCSDR